MENRGSVTSCDIHPHKLRLIEAGYQRLGLDIIHANLLDGKERKAELLNSFDLIIADVPCSGLGIIRKKPDIRYKDPEPLENLPRVQAAILDNVADYVRPGGVLLYATCTLLGRENGGSREGVFRQAERLYTRWIPSLRSLLGLQTPACSPAGPTATAPTAFSLPG